MFDIVGALGRLLGRHKPEAQPQVPQQRPDITLDPSGSVPYSARTPELAKMGNRYTANPTSPEFLGVDPAQFGYPEDNTVRRPQEDDGYVLGPRGPEPLSSINPGEPWGNLRRNILGR